VTSGAEHVSWVVTAYLLTTIARRVLFSDDPVSEPMELARAGG
jgi:hypothetical protein